MKNPKNISRSLIPNKIKNNNYVKQVSTRSKFQSKKTNSGSQIKLKNELQNNEN